MGRSWFDGFDTRGAVCQPHARAVDPLQPNMARQNVPVGGSNHARRDAGSCQLLLRPPAMLLPVRLAVALALLARTFFDQPLGTQRRHIEPARLSIIGRQHDTHVTAHGLGPVVVGHLERRLGRDQLAAHLGDLQHAPFESLRSQDVIGRRGGRLGSHQRNEPEIPGSHRGTRLNVGQEMV